MKTPLKYAFITGRVIVVIDIFETIQMKFVARDSPRSASKYHKKALI